MIDLHAHLLPYVDHGSRDWEETLAMARVAVADGISGMAVTPHVNPEFPNSAATIRPAVDELRARLAAASIPLEIHVGADYLLTPELLENLPSIITLGDNGTHFLLEFHAHIVPRNLSRIIKRFQDAGLTPIVTHPERNAVFPRRPELLEEMLRLGCLVQVTAGSLSGDFGAVALRHAAWLLEQGWCHLLASDAHWLRERPPVLSAARELVARRFGEEDAERLFTSGPARILRGLPPHEKEISGIT